MPNAINYFALACTIIFTALGQLSFKIYFTRKKIYFILGMCILFMLAQISGYIALRKIELGIVYMSSSLTHICIYILSYFFLNEKITKNHVIALILIITGVIMYAC